MDKPDSEFTVPDGLRDAEMIVYDFTDELSRAFQRRAAQPEKDAFTKFADRILPPRTRDE